MNRIGIGMVLVLVAGAGCSDADVPLPPPSRVGELLSLARVQDPASVEVMADALRSRSAAEREMAAFGLGQLGVAWEPPPDEVRARAEEAVIAALGGEREAAVRDRLIEALGKVGAEGAVAALEPVVDSAPGTERVRAAIALALIARSSGGMLVSAAALDAMARMMEDADPAVRFGGAYGLLRYRDPATKPVVVAGLQDSDPQVRATCARALFAVSEPGDASLLSPLLEDPDDRVAAEASRTLTRLAMACETDACPALQALLEAPGPLRPSIMQTISFESWLAPSALTFFQARFDEYAQATGLEPSTRALLECQAALGYDRANGSISLLSQCGAGVIDDARRDVLKANALVPTGGAELEALLASSVAVVRVAAAAGAPATALPALLADPDPIVVATAAYRAEELAAVEVAPDLVAALTRFQDADEALDAQMGLLSACGALGVQEAVAPAEHLLEADPYALRQIAAHTLTLLTGEPLVPRLPAALGPAPQLEPTTVRLTTTRGAIRIQLFVDDAPRTAQNFVDLVRRPFYDGITVHRVVPNFVAQAGDPRGDGSGGPGYTIPCEMNLQRYGEGTVGMALSGRDTGGSQFFIAHGAQPHLDGSYTTFGTVIEGMDVANGIIEGDVILEARVE
jgi:cyclophilin family peptidyl-prolyl cis-trans isomerase